MIRSEFHVAHMDCPAEEQLVRMALAGNVAVQSLVFDLPNRQLTIWHNGPVSAVAEPLARLNLGDTLLRSESAESAVAAPSPTSDRALLWAVLGINAVFFVLESIAGWWAGSMGLLADALDMGADALVYGLSLYALGRAARHQQRIATLSGTFQLLLALGGLAEVLRRFFGDETPPDATWMMGVSALALVGNALCLWLLNRSGSGQVSIRASQIFTANDVVANLGVIVAGGLVLFTRSPLPDLIVGLIVFGLVARGAVRIFSLRAT